MGAVPKILLTQAAVALAAGGIAWWGFGPVAGYSAWLGGAICVIPSAYLAFRMLATRGSGQPRKMLNATYLGEAGKLVLTVALFAIIFIAVKPLSPGALIAGFIAAQSSIWIAILSSDTALN